MARTGETGRDNCYYLFNDARNIVYLSEAFYVINSSGSLTEVTT